MCGFGREKSYSVCPWKPYFVGVACEEDVRPEKWTVLSRGCHNLLDTLSYFHTELVEPFFTGADQLDIIAS